MAGLGQLVPAEFSGEDEGAAAVNQAVGDRGGAGEALVHVRHSVARVAKGQSAATIPRIGPD